MRVFTPDWWLEHFELVCFVLKMIGLSFLFGGAYLLLTALEPCT